MTERQKLVDQLIRHEGLRLKPYMDTVGKITIGVGRNLTDCGLSHAEALDLLDHDLSASIVELTRFSWFPRLDAVRQRALIDLHFNLGRTRLDTFQRFIHACAVDRWADAGQELRASRWASQVQPDRRDRLVRMIETGVSDLDEDA